MLQLPTTGASILALAVLSSCVMAQGTIKLEVAKRPEATKRDEPLGVRTGGGK